MRTQPIKDYLAAKNLALAGDREAALLHLAQALGVGEASPTMSNNLDLLLDPDTKIGDGMLQLVLVESKHDG